MAENSIIFVDTYVDIYQFSPMPKVKLKLKVQITRTVTSAIVKIQCKYAMVDRVIIILIAAVLVDSAFATSLTRKGKSK